MDKLHLTSKRNLKSILRHGILPMYVNMPLHWEAFHRAGLEERKCVYTWEGEHYNNAKYIRDMVYTKMFIHPRNKIFDDADFYVDFKKFGDQLYGTDGTYYLLKIPEVESPFSPWLHMQEPDDTANTSTTIMNDKYAHRDKLLHIFDKVIPPVKFEIVEKINVRVYKNHQLGFSHSSTF